ncbi:MAG: hypothetical protein H7177_06795 [Rhizobacter sp.]|nr:hypothetical protein [Bacteriovorax sp.]
MKLILSLVTIVLLTTTSAYADFRKDLYESVQDEIQNYYSSAGEWSVVKIKNVEEVITDSAEYRLMKAKVNLQNLYNERGTTQTCLVTFVNDNYDFYAINCF